MTAVIKADGNRDIQAFAPVHRAPSTRETAAMRTEAVLAEARGEIAELKSRLSRERDDAKAAVKEAHEAGRREGADVADKTAEQRCQAIRQGVVAARTRWDERLAELEAAAAMLAREALRKMFEPGADLADLTTRAIARQVERLSHETVAAIRVSRDDFVDAAAIDALRENAGCGAIDVVADPALKPGTCRFDLMLGQIDVTPAAQWTLLERFFTKIVEEAAA